MLQRAVKFEFHHVSSDVKNLLFSKFYIHTKYNEKNNELQGECSQLQVNEIRSNLFNIMKQYPQCWFLITSLNDIENVILPFNENIDDNIKISFGSLLSTSKFFIHETPLSNRIQWTMAFRDEKTLLIECQADQISNSTIRFTIPMEFVHKSVLVIDGNTSSDIILSIDTITANVQMIKSDKDIRLYGNDSIIQSLNRCSDILIHLSSKSNADKFLDYLRLQHNCQIYYTMIVIEHNQCKSWDNIEFNWYPMENALYAMSMLHSLGYLFEDKYLIDENLQSIMIDFAEMDDKRFYQLAIKAFDRLQHDHWLDLTTIFNKNQFDKIRTENIDQSSYVGIVHLTPTRLCIMPKKETDGHRALRHPSFGGIKNFCRVDLQPDPTEKYLTNNYNALKYFRDIFETGIQLGRNRFYLFGSSSSQLRKRFYLYGTSNSQLSKQSFWFIRASTLDEVDQKRTLLGRLDRIDNLGTYAARLGLWFSTCSPTGIELSYCKTIEEFNERIQQRDICVISIMDVERNGFCFTDGNGFISKGLAKLVTEKLSLCTKTLQRDIFPSAYQIRMAGCKGLLIVDPQSNFDEFYVKIRPSMEKFECDYWTLDICDTSRPIQAKLNNQIILLLSDLGVPDETFLNFQNQWFQKNPSRSSLSNALLKNKIPLPSNEGRYLFGCAFESNLKAGTCFIRYQILDENGETLPEPQFACVQGRVIVTKNPCPYAGDMIELMAVDLPELHCLSDVIVFSIEGDRPDFHKIAGSDLDGDGYFVYWGKEFDLQHSVPPLAYKPGKKTQHSTPISSKDLIGYYLSTLGAASYGEIYNLHAVIVDRNDENHLQRTCQTLAIKLAEIFAHAIDSGKTGYVINQGEIEPIRKKYKDIYPDFLMKRDKPNYPSQSIVGKLYRNAVIYKNSNVETLNNSLTQINISDTGSQMSLNSLPMNNSFP